ncbi:MAG: FliH/SctL family protein [Phycisphaerales bacterium]|nr:FliH/SctL family protein [Phycisphaerales bacterium]
MTIIKQNQVDMGDHRLASIEIEDFDRRAETLISTAQEAAQQIIEAARAEAARLLEESRTAGWEAGHASGTTEGEAQGREQAQQEHSVQVEAIVTSWSAMLEQWQADRAAMFRSAEQDVLAMAVQLAEQIVHRTTLADPGVVRDQLQSALGLVRHASDVQIVINPRDQPLVEELLEELVASFSNCNDVSIQVDPTLAPGGCRLELEGGSIDATLETQLQRMASLLLMNESDDQVVSHDPRS